MTDHTQQILPAFKGQGGNHTPDAPQGAWLFLVHVMRKANSHAALQLIVRKTTAPTCTRPRQDHTALQAAPALASGGAI